MRKHKILLSTIAAIIVIIIAGATLFNLYNNRDSIIFKCEADVRYDVNDGQNFSSIDALYVLAISANKKGFLHISGVVKKNGKKIDLNRAYDFIYRKKGQVDFYNVLITKERVSIYDEVDNDYFQKTFLPERPGLSINIKARKLKDNLYMFDGFTYTHFICTKASD
ncbi:hypothetical protein [Enterobacter ludwigii]